LRENKVGADVKWKTFDVNGAVQDHKGFLHSICDGGYPPYGSLVCAKTGTTDPDILAWNNRLGQIRKDVECCFGSLKKRFRIFKHGWRSQSMLMLDDAWFTCCALHNLLLEFDDELEPGDRDDDEADQGIGLENEVDMLNA